VPFNLLLIPLIAGYLFLSQADLFAYSTSLLQKEQLLIRVSVVGLLLAVVSRLACFLLTQHAFGARLQETLYHFAPFPYIGTALATLPLAYVARKFVNFLVPANIAGDWLYHAGLLNQMESLLLRSAFGVPPYARIGKLRLLWIQFRRLCVALRTAHSSPRSRKSALMRLLVRIRRVRRRSIFPFGDLLPLMLTMSDGKVYVGYIRELPPVTGDGLQYVRLLPLWSGYRDSVTKEVFKVTSYFDVVRRANDETTLLKVFPCSLISVAGIFEDNLFDIPMKAARRKRNLAKHRRIARPRRPKITA
jgi:hypothetical protein